MLKNNYKQMNIVQINQYLQGEKITVIDIGARGGIHARWNSFSPLLNVIGFEPDENECQRINETAKSKSYELKCLPYALGKDNNSKASLHICKEPGCSSLYEPNLEFVKQFYFAPNMEVVNSYNLTLTTLRDICDKYEIIPDCIKIDTQGSELDILMGMQNILDNLKFIELEVEFNPQYKNQPLFSDIDLFLRKKGFLLLGIKRTYWRRRNRKIFPRSPFGGQIMHGDAIYYNARILEELQPDSIKEILKLLIILSAYKQDDLIAYLLDTPHRAFSEISEEERKILAKNLLNTPPLLPTIVRTILDLVRKKFWLPHKTLRKFMDELQSPNAEDWHDSNFF